MKSLISSILVAILLSTCHAQESNIIQLQKDWKIQSSAKIHVNAETMSSTGFDVDGWYSTAVPKTVLAAMVESGVYPDPYFGLNLKSISNNIMSIHFIKMQFLFPASSSRDTSFR